MALVVLSASGAAVPAAAQGTPIGTEAHPRLQGIVAVESTYEPVVGATVTLVGLDIETRTARLGTFSFVEVPPGPVAVRVSAPGHPTVLEEVTVTAGGAVFVQFLLPSVGAILAELLIEVEPREDAARTQAQTAADVVAEKVPSLRWRRTDTVRDYSTSVRLRGVSSVAQSLDPQIYLDGVLVSSTDALDLLNQIPAGEVDAVEVLRGPSASFLYPSAANGVILISTKR